MDAKVSERVSRPATLLAKARHQAMQAAAAIRQRNLTRPILMLGVPALVGVVAGYMYLTGGRYVSTDDAYVRAAKLMVSAEVSGVVAEVDVREGQPVKAGDTLFKIDPKPFQIALDNATAALANAELAVSAMKQDYRRMQGDIDAQRAQVALARSNLDRVTPLLAKKFVSHAAYDNARFALSAEEQKLASLEDAAKTQLVKLGGDADVDPKTHPQYLQAKAQANEAQRQLDNTTVRAPFNGVATQVSNLQRGVYVVSSMASFSPTAAIGLVSTDDLWIDANMKETDLTHVKPGNAVEVTIDTYPGKTWKAHVEAIGATTGAEFSLLPSNTSTGNWTKVVQRIPVKIRIDRAADDPPLRAGMSAIVDIDTGHSRL